MRPTRPILKALGVAALLAALAPVAPAGDPPLFSDPLASTNAYAPFEEGAVKVFRGKSEGAAIVVVDDYAAEIRTFAWSGQLVDCHLLREVEFEDGEIVEISYNWFAEADDGTVYYFGETVDDYEDGAIVGHEGSWLVGGPTLPGDPAETANAPDPAVFMPPAPEVGDQWKPEDLFPLVDETVTALDTDASVKTPAGRYEGALAVQETSELPDSTPELKWYAPGVGVVKAKGFQEKLLLIASTLTPVEEEDGED